LDEHDTITAMPPARFAPIWMVLLAVGLTAIIANAQKSQADTSELVFSSEEDTLPGALELPDCARAWLARDAHVSRRLDREHLSLVQLPSDWFVAGAIGLGDGEDKLLVVMGSDGLRGANINPFWIFRWASQSCDLLLGTAAHHLQFLKTRTNGLPDVEIGFASSGNISQRQYKFDGHAYMLAGDACRPAEAERASAIPGASPKMFLFQQPGHSQQNLRCEARDWLWRQWLQEKSFSLEVRLFSNTGENITMSYGLTVVDGHAQIAVLLQKEVAEENASPVHRLIEDKLILAVAVERRTLQGKAVSETESISPDAYELHFFNVAGKEVAVL